MVAHDTHQTQHRRIARYDEQGQQTMERSIHRATLMKMIGSYSQVKMSIPGMQIAAAVRPDMMMAMGLITRGPSDGAE